MHPEWEGAYVQYKALKQTLKALANSETAPQAEGEFVGMLKGGFRLIKHSRSGAASMRILKISTDGREISWELKRAAGDDVLYLDLKEQGNMMRLINDSQVLALVLVLVLYWYTG